VKYFLTGGEPEVTRILLIESGSRHLLEELLPRLHSDYGEATPVDLVTCYPGLPAGFSSSATTVYRVQDYREDWRRLVRELKSRGYSIAFMICSAESIMTKWKWLVALGLPAKFSILNENGDYFWIDRAHAGAVRHFVLFRAGLVGEGAVHTLSRLVAFPFTLFYLLLYAAGVHLRRLGRRVFS
jgi:hypothetical protein